VFRSPMATITTEEVVAEEVEEIDLEVEEVEAEGEEEVITDRWMIVRKIMVVLVCSIRGTDLRGTGKMGIGLVRIMDGVRSLLGVERDIDIWRFPRGDMR
jgi:hypothetical protein